ncbi:MAG TPA: DUF3488 and DUF4129 domain-containing transglutaminase family protein [Desulfobacterales bacterium]
MTHSAVAHIPALIAALAVNLLPHIGWLPWWVAGGCVATWAILLLRVRSGRSPAAPRTRRLLTLAGILAVLVGTGGALDRNTAVALLWILATVKLMEVETHRDVVVSLFLAYFLGVSVVFFTSSLMAGLFVPVGLWVTTAVLVRLHEVPGGWRRPLKVSARLLIQAVPIAVVLFVFFPRMHGGLWGIAAEQAVSGFSDVLSSGTISEIVLSREVAFRVEFEDEVPAIEHLYWRGLTFDAFDGRSWHRSGERGRAQPMVFGGRPVQYTITMEPHGRQWLFALDLPVEARGRLSVYSDYTLMKWRKVKQNYTYAVESRVDYRSAGPSELWEAGYLQLPARGNPRARKLAAQWRQQAGVSSDVVDLGLRFFRENGFRYTLRPPLLGDDAVDSLLFDTRQGYCEHYASTFAFLMRAAGIPARVVAGYLGAEPNPYADYWMVRQLHAHAWVEVWLPQSGWTRRDPTLAVEPSRILQGISEALPVEERSDLQPFRGRLGAVSELWDQLQLGWDAAENRWDRWVMAYSPQRQRSMLGRMGFQLEGAAAVLVLLLFAVGICFLLAVLYRYGFSQTREASSDAAQKAYWQFCARLARAGLVRHPHEGPLDFAIRIGSRRPDLSGEVEAIIRLYAYLRYGNRGGRAALRNLRSRIRRFRPKPERRRFFRNAVDV